MTNAARRPPSVGKISRVIRLRWGLPHVRRGDAHRGRGEWIDAVVAYRRGLEWLPWRDDIFVQIGNCLKEYGDFEGALRAYRTVGSGPSRSEAQKQMADLNRREGITILPYDIVGEPGDVPVLSEGHPPLRVTANMLPNRIRIASGEDRSWLGPLGLPAGDQSARFRGSAYATIKLQQVGSFSLERDGTREPVLAGVVAIRGRILSLSRLQSVDILLGEGTAARTIVTVPVMQAKTEGALKLAVFNAWIDTAHWPAGRSWLAVRAGMRIPDAGLYVNVATIDGDDPALAVSSSLVPSPLDERPVDAAIANAPAILRPAARSLFETPIRSILAIRADQLGDVSATLPALARLRVLFPDARLTALVQPAVEAMVVASGIVDEVMTLTLGYDPASERRSLSVEEEARLRATLPRVDLAIDLCTGGETRPLLLLAQADYLVGFDPDRFTFLDFGISIRSRDKVNDLDKLSHAAHVSSLVEALAVASASRRGTVPRTSGGDALARVGLEPGRYAVLHTGARHSINQWPYENFLALAERIIRSSDLVVACFGDMTGALPPGLAAHQGRIRMLPMLAADDFDQLISSARLLVGNDSGPKHLAAVRGVPTVSVHVGRLNWNEWGQDGEGVIVAKRVPCAGCGLNDIDLCGRDAVCIRSITVEEVFAAVRPYLESGRP